MVNGLKTVMVNEWLISAVLGRDEVKPLHLICHCEERSDEAIQSGAAASASDPGLLRYARNDASTIVLAARCVGARALSNSERKASEQIKGRRSAERRRSDCRARAAKRRRLNAFDRGARPLWETRSPSGALPRLSPKASRPWLVRSRASWDGIDDPSPRAASSSQTGVGAGRAGFRTARGRVTSPIPGTAPAPLQGSSREASPVIR